MKQRNSCSVSNFEPCARFVSGAYLKALPTAIFVLLQINFHPTLEIKKLECSILPNLLVSYLLQYSSSKILVILTGTLSSFSLARGFGCLF